MYSKCLTSSRGSDKLNLIEILQQNMGEQKSLDKQIEQEQQNGMIVSSMYNRNTFSLMKDMAQTFQMSKVFKDLSTAEIFTVMQTGREMGLKPVEAMNSLYIVNGQVNLWGKALIRRIRESGYKIEYKDETSEKVTARVYNDEEEFVETYTFAEAKASGYTHYSKGGLKVGWKEGINRKLKLRYGALHVIVKTQIPEILGSAVGIQEIEEDYVPPKEEREEVQVVDDKENKGGDLNDFLNKQKDKKEEKIQIKVEEKQSQKDEEVSEEKEEVTEVSEVKEEKKPKTAFDNAKYNKKRKEFFAVAKGLGYSSADAKKRIKKHFKVESFNDIEYPQLLNFVMQLRTKLEEKQNEQQDSKKA